MPDPRDRRARQKGSKPTLSSTGLDTAASPQRDYQQSPPVFCLHHLHPEHDVQSLADKEKQAQLALTIHRCAQQRWIDIQQSDRHKGGFEMILASQIRPQIPRKFADRDKFMVLRYCGMLPMVGVRIQDVFHVLWVERQFGDVYDHGG